MFQTSQDGRARPLGMQTALQTHRKCASDVASRKAEGGPKGSAPVPIGKILYFTHSFKGPLTACHLLACSARSCWQELLHELRHEMQDKEVTRLL